MSRCTANGVTVSVVISTYNRCHFLPEALDSVLNQTRPPDEVIVVDDGSTDATPDVLRRYADCVRCFRVGNGGKPAALNMAIPGAVGSHVWVFDDDDVALPDALAAQLGFLARHQEIDFSYSSKYRTRNGNVWNREAWDLERAPELPPGQLFAELMRGMFMTMQGTLIPKQCLIDIGLFDVSLIRAQDYDLMLRLAARFRGGHLGIPTFVLREHAGLRGNGAQWPTRRQQDQKVLAYTQAVLRKARGTFPLDAYLASPARRADSALSARERSWALWQRGCAMLRRGLTEDGMEDLAAALAGRGHDEFSTGRFHEELALALSTDPVAFRHPYRLIVILGRLLGQHGGRAIMPALARGPWWSLRRALRRKTWSEMRVAVGMLALALLCHPRWVLRRPTPLDRAGCTTEGAIRRDG